MNPLMVELPLFQEFLIPAALQDEHVQPAEKSEMVGNVPALQGSGRGLLLASSC
jgi:hypothetical protein